MKQRYTQTEYEQALKDAYIQLGEGFTAKQYQQWASNSEDRPSLLAVTIFYGDFNQAKRKNNLPVSRKTRRSVSEQACRDSLQRAIDVLGPNLTTSEYEIFSKSGKGKYVSLHTIYKRLGRWNEAMEKMGYPIESRSNTRLDAVKTKEYCIQVMQEVSLVHGKAYSKKTYEKWRLQQEAGYAPTSKTLVRKFGSWKEAKFAANLLECENAKSNDYVDKTDCLQALEEASYELGKRFSAKQYMEWRHGRDDYPSDKTISKRLENWRMAMEALSERMSAEMNA